MSYARLAAPELWLAEYERAVYLDSDISIHGSLAPLFALDLRGAMAAMVEDCGCYLRGAGDQESWNAYRAALGLDPAAVYFNAGMMLMDLKAMRATRLWSRTEAFMAIHGAGIIFMDQDALNVLAAGQIAELSPRWNFMTHFLGLGLEAQMQPRIFHYADVLKPWRDPEWRILYGWQAPRHFARLFRGSPWAGYVPRGLYARWPLPWQSRAAAQQAQHSRRLTPEYVAAHVAHYRAMAAQLRGSVGQGFREAAAAGRYIDASPPGRR
jgi:lipopolysaccharide biosynthesis glycosyltransferase